MVRIDKNTGNLIIEMSQEHTNAYEEIFAYRESIYSAITAVDMELFSEDDLYYLIGLLQKTEPTIEQWKTILNADCVHND